ncbi:hypothetical protein EDD11_009084 [Mortierella claussenii]|nr:hypothetical protein EDD11_009084 [Mortierella claussenii]
MYKAALAYLREPGPVEAKKDVLHTHAEKAKYTTLQVIQQVLLWIKLGLFTPPTSEHVYVSAWAMLFNILLFDTTIRAVPEFVWKASTDSNGFEWIRLGSLNTGARQLVEDEFGSTTSTSCGRKVDLSIRIQVDNGWKTEIAIFEFKALTSSRQMCEKQQKSVRLNAAILLELEARGLDIQHSYPIIAEGKGVSLDFYTLRRYDDILGAGRSTAKGLSLPSQISQLKTFLQSNSILTLLSFREHLRRYAMDVVNVLAMSPLTPFGDSDEDDPPSTPGNPPSTPADPPSAIGAKLSNLWPHCYSNFEKNQQYAFGPILEMPTGKKNPDHPLFSGFVRNSNKKEFVPDFRLNTWKTNQLLFASDRDSAMNPSTFYRSLAQVMKAPIEDPNGASKSPRRRGKVGPAGQRAGAQQAQDNGASLDELFQHGHWNHRRLVAHYLSPVTKRVPFILAGFTHKDQDFWFR